MDEALSNSSNYFSLEMKLLKSPSEFREWISHGEMAVFVENFKYAYSSLIVHPPRGRG